MVLLGRYNAISKNFLLKKSNYYYQAGKIPNTKEAKDVKNIRYNVKTII